MNSINPNVETAIHEVRNGHKHTIVLVKTFSQSASSCSGRRPLCQSPNLNRTLTMIDTKGIFTFTSLYQIQAPPGKGKVLCAAFHCFPANRDIEKGDPHYSHPPGTPFTWKAYLRNVKTEIKYGLPALILSGIFAGYLAGREKDSAVK